MPRGRPSTRQGAPAFGERLRNLRRDRGFTQVTLAKALGITQQTVSAHEKGGAWPSPRILIRLARTLQVTTDELLGVKDVKVPPLSTSSARMWTRFKKLRALKPAEQSTIWGIIETFFARHERHSAENGTKAPPESEVPPTKAAHSRTGGPPDTGGPSRQAKAPRGGRP